MAAATGEARARAGVRRSGGGGGDGRRLRGVGFLLSEAAAAQRGALYSWECERPAGGSNPRGGGSTARMDAEWDRPEWIQGLAGSFVSGWAVTGQNIGFEALH